MAKKSVRGGSASSDENKTSTLVTGKNYFLGIGINKYANYTPLRNACNDVKAIFEILEKTYNFDIACAEMLFDEQATRNNILNKIKELRNKATKDDRVLLYYSGHGYVEDNLGYWIPQNAQKSEIGDFVSNADVTNHIQKFQAKHVLLISDSCFSGSLLMRDSGVAIKGAYADWDNTESRLAFISGKGVVEDGIGQNSPFAEAIIKELAQNIEPIINIGQIADDVIKRVRFNHAQQAELNVLFGTGHQGGQFLFCRKATPQSDEQTAWFQAQTRDDSAVYLEFIRKYPNSKHREDAEREMRAADDRTDWHNAKKRNALSDYYQYLQKRPDGFFAAAAQTEIDRLLKLKNDTQTDVKNNTNNNTNAAETSKKKREIKSATKAEIITESTDNQPNTNNNILTPRNYFFAGALSIAMYVGVSKPWKPAVVVEPTPTITQPQNITVNPKPSSGTDVEKANTYTKPNEPTGEKQQYTKKPGINASDFSAWNRAVKTKSVEGMRDYLDKYPEGYGNKYAREYLKNNSTDKARDEKYWKK